ncbi:MAG: hypothetical protein CL537_01830 [Alcanivoracaceae bacterium]|nr:hypothetical protein [Alcanivoracaceae bacterium]|tara:strand:- start:3145 stop:3759 length:615 start_codon:yes stop_codon:yes gene_type:complete
MSQELQRRRRAIVTGLTPYMNETLLMEAVSHWQQHYADRPRFSLQGFVSDLCGLFDLAERRHQIHMSLVQAMTLSDKELASDPLAQQTPSEDHHPCTQAFQVLVESLWAQMDTHTANQFRLDLAAQLRSHQTGPEARLTLEYWLQNPSRHLAGLPLASLRQQLNNAYVILCERQGPVEADRLLRDAYRMAGSKVQSREALTSLM